MNKEKLIRRRIVEAEKQLRLGHYSRAREVSESILSLDPDNESGWMLQFRVIQASGSPQEISNAVNKLVTRFPDSIDSWLYHGGAAMQGNQYTEAETSFHRALELDPESIPAKIGIGGIFMLTGRNPDALHMFEQVLCQDPESWQGLRGITTMYHLLGRFDDAIGTGEKLVANGDKDPQVFRLLGDALYQTGNYPRSAVMLSQYLELVSLGSRMISLLCPTIYRTTPYDHTGSATGILPDFIEATYYHAFSGFDKETEGVQVSPISESDITKVLELNPDHAYALIAQAYLLQMKGKKTEALALTRMAINAAPEAEAFRATEGIYLIDDHPDQSVEIFNQILKNDPRHPHALLGKAMALNATGQKAEGVSILQELQKIDPELLSELLTGMSHLNTTR